MELVSSQGFFRIPQIVGQREISEAEASENRRRWKERFAEFQQLENIKRDDVARFSRDQRLRQRYRELCAVRALPRRARPAIPPLIPVSESSWWAGVKSGRYPPAFKLSDGVTVWRAAAVLALVPTDPVPVEKQPVALSEAAATA